MILFITRKYPPSVGGMQQVAFHLSRELSKHTELHLIAWSGSQAALPVFLPLAFLRSLKQGLGSKQPRLVHVADALLAPLAVLLKAALGVPATATAHGLDVTFANPLYQMTIQESLTRLDRVVCVSESTREQCRQRGVPAERLRIIPNGVDPIDLPLTPAEARRRLVGRWPELAGAQKLLLTVGRLVERKGVEHFVAEVLPSVARAVPGAHYLVVGEGPRREAILESARAAGMVDRVHAVGQVDAEMLRQAYRAADLFVMPNRRVPGDMEGFGIVALEAAAAGLGVVASRLEGITAAVVDGTSGLLLDPEDTAGWTATIVRLLKADAERLELGQRGQGYVLETYNWSLIGQRYLDEFAALGAAP